MGRKKIPRSFVEDLLSRIDIVDIVSRYVSLKQVGRNFSTLCPFHPEKTPSFVVSPEKQIFKCFGCGVGGNAITFVEKYENLSFYEAVKRICELSGIEFPSEFSEEDSEADKIVEGALKAARFFHSRIDSIKDYLEKRSIEKATAERFLIGYAPSDYHKHLKDKEILKKLHLITEKGYPFFRERLIIPIFDHSGKIVAFGGRALKDNQNPKYINSPESEFFHKNRILYGFYQAKEQILKEKEAVVVEGYFDVISLFQAGIEKAVAPMGTSLTENHAKTLKRYANRIILFFDGDEAGEKATLRSSKIFTELEIEPLIIRPPKGEDPDSLAKGQPEILARLLSNPVPLTEYLIERVKKAPLETQAEEIRKVLDIFSPMKEKNPFKFKKFLAELSVATGADIKWLEKQIFHYRNKKQDNYVMKVMIPEYEKAFIKGLIDKKIPVSLDISPNIFVSEECRKLFVLFKMKGDIPSSIEIEQEYPELGGTIAEIALTKFTEEEIKASLCRIVKKELDRRLKNTKDFTDRKKLKELYINLTPEVGGIEEIISCIH
ncbi:DNA primase [Desulfurobacterium indicum]|uniref:DNA primase n=1 Tax=Desulfurobacterium indicum TaxID=1914305 RepID=A0A1R1MJL5_9BACT|nr:DNA primase [Desulfurobacterium indicum]OMH39997.1 DNA primase [Desulfurobacterium indicum]